MTDNDVTTNPQGTGGWGPPKMSNRVLGEDHFVNDYQREAMRIVNQARVQREVARDAGDRVLGAFWRVLQRVALRRVQVGGKIRKVIALGKEVAYAAIRGGADVP